MLNMSRAKQLDKAIGCFLGLAIGDALGVTLEFSDRDSLPHQSEITGGGPFKLRRGDYSDDTAMALALGSSMIQEKGFNKAAALEEWLSWYRGGKYSSNGWCFDIGNTTKQGLESYERSGILQAQNDGKGNGGIMRLAPVVCATYRAGASLTRELAMSQSKCTHGSSEATYCAREMATLCRGLVRDDLTRKDIRFVKPRQRRWDDLCRHEVSSSGLASHSLEAALWSVHNTDNFEDALVLAVNLGDDSDSTGAICGQIAGALYGASAIPARWSSKVKHWRKLCRVADGLVNLDLRLVTKPKKVVS